MKNVQPNDPIISSGCRILNKDMTSWINWYVYRPDYPVEAIEEEFHNHISSEGGHIYSKKPTVRVSSTKILVKQLIGWDV